ncbi:CoA carboxylase [Aureococcus anophagefferens]|nr:CoA carboxylase [Aureococcus anophagefferens]
MGSAGVLKARAGGGGRGIRRVSLGGDLAADFERCASEASRSFGGAEEGLLVEDHVWSARHVEVQVAADSCGAVATLFDRECSLQRRHQKLIEVAPAPFLDDTLRRVETALAEGLGTHPSFDSLVAKVIVNAPTYERALDKARRAVDDFGIEGPSTNLRFLSELLSRPEVLDATATTTFVDDAFPDDEAAALGDDGDGALRSPTAGTVVSVAPEEELAAKTPADGVLTGVGMVGAAPAVVVAVDATVLAGTQGFFHHHKLDRAVQVAAKRRLPIIALPEGGGGRPNDGDVEGLMAAGLFISTWHAYAALAGVVPRVAVVSGYCFAGSAAIAGCSDVVIATETSSLGMGGPAMIEGGGLGRVKPEDVGPAPALAERGVVDVVAADDAAALDAAKRYLSYFAAPVAPPAPAGGDQRLLRRLVPENRKRAYDMRAILDVVCDEGSVFELRDRFGRSVITALARVDGRAVGILASDPARNGGAVDADAADKAARFLRLCDAFGLPVVSLLDCPGFMVGPDAERDGMLEVDDVVDPAETRDRIVAAPRLRAAADGVWTLGMTSATTTRDAPADKATASDPPCAVCGQHAGRYACPRCDVRYCSLACFGKHGECSERFYAQRVRRALAEEPGRGRARCVGDLLSKGEDDDDARAAPSEARLLALLEGRAEATAEEEAMVLAAAKLEDAAPWTPWWAGVGRFDDDVAACEAGRAAVARAGLADAAAADALRAGGAAAPRRQRRRAAVLGRSAAAPPLWALVWRDGDGAGAPVEAAARKVAGERLAVTAAPLPRRRRDAPSLRLRRRAPRRRRGRGQRLARGLRVLAGGGGGVDAALEAAPPPPRRRGHGALLRDVAALLAAPAVAAAALLDAWSLVVLARGAPPPGGAVPRLWCGAPLGRNQPQPDFNVSVFGSFDLLRFENSTRAIDSSKISRIDDLTELGGLKFGWNNPTSG